MGRADMEEALQEGWPNWAFGKTAARGEWGLGGEWGLPRGFADSGHSVGAQQHQRWGLPGLCSSTGIGHGCPAYRGTLPNWSRRPVLRGSQLSLCAPDAA